MRLVSVFMGSFRLCYLRILGAVTDAKYETGLMSQFTRISDTLKVKSTETEVKQLRRNFMEQSFITVKKHHMLSTLSN